MFLCISFVFVGLLSVSTAADVCLSANKYTASMMQLGAQLDAGSTVPRMDEFYSTMDYDGDQLKARLYITRYDAALGAYTNSTYFKDYRHDKAYTIVGGNCQVTTTRHDPVAGPCFPGLTKTRSYTVGGGSITVNIYSGQIGGEAYTIHLTSTGEPFFSSNYGTDSLGGLELQTQMYADVKMGHLSEAAILSLPTDCHSTVPVGK